MDKQNNVLYITYDGLCDPLGQSQILPYLHRLAKKNVKIVILSFEKKETFEKRSLLDKTSFDLSQNGIVWKPLLYHKKPCLFATLYDTIIGYINGLLLITKRKISIVHARGYISAFIAFWIKKSIRTKFIFDMRGFWVDEKVDSGFWGKKDIGYKMANFFERKMLNSSDQIIVLTEKARSYLTNSIANFTGAIDVIPTCCDLENFRVLENSRKGLLQHKIIIVYSGSIGTFYGFKDAINFFRILHAKEEASFFVALINNEKEAAEKMLRASNISSEFYKVLSLPHSEVPNWLKEADASLILYHRNDSSAGCCPTKFGESLACGVPVIINKGVGDCDDVIRKEKIGFVLDDFTDSSYQKIAGEFLYSLKERDALRHRCRSVAEKLFSLDSGVSKYLSIYNRLTQN